MKHLILLACVLIMNLAQAQWVHQWMNPDFEEKYKIAYNEDKRGYNFLKLEKYENRVFLYLTDYDVCENLQDYVVTFAFFIGDKKVLKNYTAIFLDAGEILAFSVDTTDPDFQKLFFQSTTLKIKVDHPDCEYVSFYEFKMLNSAKALNFMLN
jgi:hypothetical protein